MKWMTQVQRQSEIKPDQSLSSTAFHLLQIILERCRSPCTAVHLSPSFCPIKQPCIPWSLFQFLTLFTLSFLPPLPVRTPLLLLHHSPWQTPACSFGRTLLFVVAPVMCVGAQSVSLFLKRQICLKVKISACWIPHVNDSNSVCGGTGSQIFPLLFSFTMHEGTWVPDSQRCGERDRFVSEQRKVRWEERVFLSHHGWTL